MKNKATKLRTHTSSKKKNPQFCFLIIRNLYPKKITIPCFAGRYIHFPSRREGKWIFLPAGYFPSLQNLNNVEIRGLTRLIILLKMK